MNWRTIIILTLAASLFATTAFASGGTYTIRRSDGTTEQVQCDLNDHTVENVLAFAWNPPCTELTSGDVVTWVGTGGTHDPGSELDQGLGGLPPQNDDGCFRMVESETHGNGLTNGAQYTVRFTYDSTSVTASYRFEINGVTHWSDPAECNLAKDLQQSTLDTAVIPYRCFIHPEMQGLVVVHKLGGIG